MLAAMVRWGTVVLAGVALCVTGAGCTRNRTPAQPYLEVKSGEVAVSGAVLIGQPLTLIADWHGSCEQWGGGTSKEDPFKGSWSPGTCNEVTTFDLVVKCSLPCAVGRQWVDRNTVYREVIPQQAGNLTLDILYTTPFHHDRRMTYSVTVRMPRSATLVGCANQKEISLDAFLFVPPGQPVPWQPIYCKKLDQEAEGPLKIVAVTTDDQKMFMQITAPGLYKPLQTELSIVALEKLFGPALEFGVYPVRIEVMGKPIELHIDVRERMQRAAP